MLVGSSSLIGSQSEIDKKCITNKDIASELRDFVRFAKAVEAIFSFKRLQYIVNFDGEKIVDSVSGKSCKELILSNDPQTNDLLYKAEYIDMNPRGVTPRHNLTQ